jgi:hypothetical protein
VARAYRHETDQQLRASTCPWHNPATASQLLWSLFHLHRIHRTRNIHWPLRVHSSGFEQK